MVRLSTQCSMSEYEHQVPVCKMLEQMRLVDLLERNTSLQLVARLTRQKVVATEKAQDDSGALYLKLVTHEDDNCIRLRVDGNPVISFLDLEAPGLVL